MSKIIEGTDSDFDTLINDGSVLVEFGASWCGPCKMLLPVLEDLAVHYENKVKIVKIDIDQNPESTAKFGVRAVPALFLFRNGIVAMKHSGAIPKSQLVAKIDPLIK